MVKTPSRQHSKQQWLKHSPAHRPWALESGGNQYRRIYRNPLQLLSNKIVKMLQAIATNKNASGMPPHLRLIMSISMNYHVILKVSMKN
jgi:hypothetical protein